MKKLYLITQTFPYGNKECFLGNEIPFFNVFDKVVVFPLYPNGNQTFSLPPNMVIRKIRPFIKKKWLIPFYYIKFLLTSKIVMQETLNIFKQGVSLTKLYTMTLMMSRAYHFSSAIYEAICEDTLESPDDELYLYSYWMEELSLTAVLLSKRMSFTKVISRTHSYDLYEERSPIHYIPFQHTVIKNMDLICPISQNGTNYLQQKFHSKNIVLSRLGTKDWGVENVVNKDIKQLVVVSCSYCIELKRIHLIIDALRMINDIEVKWIHFGGGELYEELLQQAKNLGKNIECNFVGNKSNTEILQYYKNHYIDLFLNVSSSEGIPVSIMEAMSFGIPVIATNVGRTSEIVTNGENGILLDKDFNVSDLANYIRKFGSMSSREAYYWRKNARIAWENNYSAKDNYPKFFNMIIKKCQN